MTYLPHSTLFLTSTRRQHRFTAGSMERNGASDISPSESLGFRKRIESIRVLKKGHNLSTTTSATGHFHMVTVESNYRELAITYSPCPPPPPKDGPTNFYFLDERNILLDIPVVSSKNSSSTYQRVPFSISKSIKAARQSGHPSCCTNQSDIQDK